MIKPAYEALPINQGNSYTIRMFNEVEFTAPFHYHPEFELTAILKGQGNRFVGNHLSSFTIGDVVLLGSNLPHCWKSELFNSNEINASSIVVQFKDDFLGPSFFDKFETKSIRHLLKKSQHGIQFTGDTAKRILNKMLHLPVLENPFTQLLTFLDILNDLSLSQDFIILNKEAKKHQQMNYENRRLNTIQGYIIENFRDKISLTNVADLVSMSPNAFCKYYKKFAGKTFVETVTEYRLNHAIQLLIHTEKPVTDVCFESGFTDVSYFFKVFKSKLQISPSRYRNKFLKNVK